MKAEKFAAIDVNKGNQVEKGNVEGAIASYFCSIQQNPNESWPHHQLGDALTRLGNFDAAATAYGHAIKLDPEAFESHYQLGNVLSRLQKTDEAIVAYQQALQRKPDILEAYCQLVELWANQNQWDEVISCYQKACELQPSLRVVDFFNQNFLNWESLATACLHAIVEKADSPSLYRLLGEALMYLQKGGQILTTLSQSLAILLPDKENALKFYHDLALRLSEQGFVDEGVACFREAPQSQLTQGEIYENIWKGLNQLGVLDESNPNYQVDINPEEAKNYFMQTSQYRTIILESLTDDDKSFLEQTGISLANLQLITQDNRFLEEIYINSFSNGSLSDPISDNNLSDSLPIKLAQEVNKGFAYYQQSIVETGYVYSICPLSGRVLRSNQSFYIQHATFLPTGLYRFVGNEVFYFIVGCHHAIWLAIYFPRWELIIRPANNPFSTDHFKLFNELKGGAVGFWQQFKNYISNENKKEIAAVVGWLGNLGHYFWNDLSGIQHLSDNKILSKVNKFLMGNYNFFNIGEIFPEIPPEDIIDIPDGWSLLRTTLENNYFAVRLTDLVIKDRLANKISQAAISRCSQEFLQEVEKSKKHFPLVWIQIRLSYRIWVSQVEGIANIIKALHSDYPNLGVIIAGNWYFTETDKIEGCPQSENEKATLEKILDIVPPNINIYSVVGRPSYEIIAWVNAIDTYIVPYASGLTFVVKIANKPGVIHAGMELAASGIEHSVASMRENSILPVVARDNIVDLDGSIPILRNYDCDWKGIYNEVVKIINSIVDE